MIANKITKWRRNTFLEWIHYRKKSHYFVHSKHRQDVGCHFSHFKNVYMTKACWNLRRSVIFVMCQRLSWKMRVFTTTDRKYWNDVDSLCFWIFQFDTNIFNYFHCGPIIMGVAEGVLPPPPHIQNYVCWWFLIKCSSLFRKSTLWTYGVFNKNSCSWCMDVICMYSREVWIFF